MMGKKLSKIIKLSKKISLCNRKKIILIADKNHFNSEKLKNLFFY